MLNVFVLTSFLLIVLFSVYTGAEHQTTTSLQPPPFIVNTNSINGITDLMIKAYRSCAEIESIQCVRRKTIHLLDIVSKEKSVQLIGDTLQLVRDSEVNNVTGRDQSKERSLVESLSKFLNIYRLQINLPKLTYLQDIEQGRKKNKGYGGLGLIMGGSLLAMGMAALAALSGKALAASLAALMLAAMAALRKGGGGGHGHSSYEVITVPSHHHHRSFYEEDVEHPHHQEHHHGGVEQHHNVDGHSASTMDDYHRYYSDPYQYEQPVQPAGGGDHSNYDDVNRYKQHHVGV